MEESAVLFLINFLPYSSAADASFWHWRNCGFTHCNLILADVPFMKAFVTSYRSFTDPLTFLSKLQERYRVRMQRTRRWWLLDWSEMQFVCCHPVNVFVCPFPLLFLPSSAVFHRSRTMRMRPKRLCTCAYVLFWSIGCRTIRTLSMDTYVMSFNHCALLSGINNDCMFTHRARMKCIGRSSWLTIFSIAGCFRLLCTYRWRRAARRLQRSSRRMAMKGWPRRSAKRWAPSYVVLQSRDSTFCFVRRWNIAIACGYVVWRRLSFILITATLQLLWLQSMYSL